MTQRKKTRSAATRKGEKRSTKSEPHIIQSMIEWNSNNYLIKVKESFSIFIHFIASFFFPFVARADEIPRAGPFIENWVCNTHKILFFESFFHNPGSFERRFLSFFFRANGGDRLVVISEAENSRHTRKPIARRVCDIKNKEKKRFYSMNVFT